MDDALIARLDVRRRHLRAIVEENIRPQLEGVGETVGRDTPRFRQVSDDLRVIGRVEFEEGRVMRCDRVEEGEGNVAVAVVIAGLDENGELKGAAALLDQPGRRVTARRRDDSQGDREHDHGAAPKRRGRAMLWRSGALIYLQ